MKKSKVMLAAVALTVAGIVSASAQMIVYDYKADVRNPEATTFIGGVSPYQKLVDTAFTAKNTFTGYVFAEVCCEADESAMQPFVMLLTRKGDTSKKYYLVDMMGVTGLFEDVDNQCDSDYGYMYVGVYEKGVGGPLDPPDCRWPINIAKIKTAEVESYWGDNGALPGFLFGAAGLRFTYGDEALPFARYYMPETYGYSTWFDVYANGFGTIKPVGSSIGCEPGGGFCSYIDKADGTLVGYFGMNTKCGDDVIWDICSLGMTELVTCGMYGLAEVAAPVAFYDSYGLIAGTWSMKVNSKLTKLQDWDLIWTAVMLKHGLIMQTQAGYVYNRSKFVEALCPVEP